MTINVYANNCMSCSSSVRPYISILKTFCYVNGHTLLLKDTRYSEIAQQEAAEHITLLNLDHYDIIANYPAFAYCEETNKATELKGLSHDTASQIVL